MAALAFDRRDAADRLSHGLGLVEAVARRGAADRRRRRRRQAALRGQRQTSCCACRRASRKVRTARRSNELRAGAAALLEVAAPDVTGGGSNNWALAPRPHGDRPPAGRRRSASRARNAQHVRADACRLRRVRRHRPHRPRRAGLSAFRRTTIASPGASPTPSSTSTISIVERFSDDGGSSLFKDAVGAGPARGGKRSR